MNEEQIRQIVREEFDEFLASDRYVFHKLVQFLDGRNIQVGTTTGTKIGTAVSQRLSVYGVTPIIQRSGSAQAAVVTTGATTTTPWGYATEAQANAIITLVNELRQALVSFGVIKGSS